VIRLSIVIPVYNRPAEVDELLQSLVCQTNTDFEVIIVEDGSADKCDGIVKSYDGKLKIHYYFKENSGPGKTRNYGASKAGGNYLIFFDSDCIIPENYIDIIHEELEINYTDAYGGPDKAHHSFSAIQKAINYSMVSFFTTGGIRGSSKSLDKFYPRSFNMGLSKQVFDSTGGFSELRFGEDIDFSLRIIKAGFSTRLIPRAFVYHKRRSNFRTFFKQVFNSGIARINLYRRHPESLKPVHLFPALFTAGILVLLVLTLFAVWIFIAPVVIYCILLYVDSLIKNRNQKVAFLSVCAGFIQITGYGLGFIKAALKRIIFKQNEFHVYEKNFYK
jgi:glycosyltransferase involved in cell wall biosynthesis